MLIHFRHYVTLLYFNPNINMDASVFLSLRQWERRSSVFLLQSVSCVELHEWPMSRRCESSLHVLHVCLMRAGVHTACHRRENIQWTWLHFNQQMNHNSSGLSWHFSFASGQTLERALFIPHVSVLELHGRFLLLLSS